MEKIEDVRGSKRDYIVDRAKKLMLEIKGSTNSREISNEIKDSTRMAGIQKYGEEELPCGDISKKEIIVVEGRADVLNLMKKYKPERKEGEKEILTRDKISEKIECFTIDDEFKVRLVPVEAFIRHEIVNVMGMAGMRGLLLGVVLGTVVTALRILVAGDRSHSEL